MPTDLRVVLPNRPGALVEALAALAESGVNIDSFCGEVRPGERWGFLHLLVEDAGAASAALQGVGFEITGEHEVDVIEIEDRPGALAEMVKRYADAGRNNRGALYRQQQSHRDRHRGHAVAPLRRPHEGRAVLIHGLKRP